MLRTLFSLVMIAGLITTGVQAKTDEERVAEVLSAAQGYVDNYRHVRDEATLAEAYGGIEKSWQAFVRTLGTNHKLVGDFSLIRARAATAAKDKKRIVRAWLDAIQFKGGNIPPQQLASVNIEAAHAAAVAEDFAAAKQFFAAARAYAFVRGDNAELARLHMRIQELKLIGGSMEWRALRDALQDLRSFSETFAMWTVPRLEAVISETEIRLQFQPENGEKREALSSLKAEITLIVDGVSDSLPAGYMARVRSLNYALEDHYQL